MTYSIVSVLPIITDAQSAGKLSAPYLASSEEYAAVEALPETGRVSRSGSISAGTPTRSAMGERAVQSASSIPEAFSIFIAIISAMRVGSMEIAV